LPSTALISFDGALALCSEDDDEDDEEEEEGKTWEELEAEAEKWVGQTQHARSILCALVAYAR